MAGRPAQPATLRLLKGRAPGKDSAGRKVKLPPKFRKISPTAPEWLADEARAEWERIVPELLRLELLKAEDGAALVQYCETWAVFVDATKKIHAEGLTYEAKQGTLARPEVAIARTASRELRAWAGQFGLTPVAENALAIGDLADGDEDSPFGASQSGG